MVNEQTFEITAHKGEEEPPTYCGYEDFWNEEKQKYMLAGVDITAQVNGDEPWSPIMAEGIRRLFPPECWPILGIVEEKDAQNPPLRIDDVNVEYDKIIDTGKDQTKDIDYSKIGSFLDLFGIQTDSSYGLSTLMSSIGSAQR